MIAIPLAGAVGGPVGVSILRLDGRFGLAGWRWLFLIEGIPSVLLGFAVLALLTERVDDARWLSHEQRAWLDARLRRDADESASPHGVSLLRVLTHPTVWLIGLPFLLINTALYGYTYWAPIVIRDTLHAGTLTTGLLFGAIACACAAVMLGVGESSDRSGERCLHAAAGATLCALGYLGAALLPTPVGRVIGLAVASFGMCALIPLFCLPSMLLRGTAAATGSALVNSIGNLGGITGPYVIAFSKDRLGGTTSGFLTLAGLALVAATFFLAIRRHPTFAVRGRVGSSAGKKLGVRASA
jgi:sugar phosphate permease